METRTIKAAAAAVETRTKETAVVEAAAGRSTKVKQLTTYGAISGSAVASEYSCTTESACDPAKNLVEPSAGVKSTRGTNTLRQCGGSTGGYSESSANKCGPS